MSVCYYRVMYHVKYTLICRRTCTLGCHSSQNSDLTLSLKISFDHQVIKDIYFFMMSDFDQPLTSAKKSMNYKLSNLVWYWKQLPVFPLACAEALETGSCLPILNVLILVVTNWQHARKLQFQKFVLQKAGINYICILCFCRICWWW